MNSYVRTDSVVQAPLQVFPAGDPDDPLTNIDELPVPYIEMDNCGLITRANRAALKLCPVEDGTPIGKLAWDFVAADEKDPSFATFCTALETGEKPEPSRRSIYDASGRFRVYEMHSGLLRDREGKPSGMRVVFVDVTEMTKAFEQAHRKCVWLENVMNSLGAAVIVTDAMGLVRAVNPLAEALLGWTAAELEGALIEQALPVVGYGSPGLQSVTFREALASTSKGLVTVLDRERRELRLDVVSAPVVDKENGSTDGVVLVLREV